jgi:hypothetical protein
VATAEEMTKAEREATQSEFDTKGLKAGVWHAWKRGEYKCICKASALARVVVFAPEGVEPNWLVWGKIFQWFGASPKGPWLVTWFAAESKRCFPTAGELGPDHVNGGYTTGCSNAGIYIYRREEATRVLIHEMMHAACLDEQSWDIPDREAMVETWAELILIALKAKGDVKKALALWAKQAAWIANSNARSERHGVNDETDYAWRYLVGRREMYARLGIDIPAPTSDHPSKSSRFTDPALDM